MSAKVSDRFQKIPRLQQARESEYARQATEAEALLSRLHQTRIEAESVAREEIARTRSIQVREFQNHPEMIKWRQSISQVRAHMSEWNRTSGQRKQELQNQIKRLESKLAQKQAELERAQRDIDLGLGKEREVQDSINRMQSELASLQADFKEAQQLEANIGTKLNSAFAQYNSLQKEIEDLKGKREQFQRDIESLRKRERELKVERESILNELDRVQAELASWDHRIAEVEGAMYKAERVQAEAQELVETHRQKIQSLKAEQSQIEDQVQMAKKQRTLALENLGKIGLAINEKQGKVKELEDAARPVKDRLQEIERIREALLKEEAMLSGKFQELNSGYERQNKELDMLKPTQSEAQNQLEQCNKLFQDCENRSADIASVLQNEMRTMQEFESKAEEAHREVHNAKSLEQQAIEGRKSVIQSADQYGNRATELGAELREIQNRIGQYKEGGYDPQFEHKKEEFDRYEREYKGLIEEERNVKGRKDSIGHQIGHLESQLRTAQQSLDTSRGHPRKDYASRIREEIDVIERDLNTARTELPQLDQNPFETELVALEREESEVEARVYSFWTPQRAPPSLINQLKRETEAVLRAEAALTLERRQKAICDEAKNLSRYHINTSPSIDIDEEARTTLLKEHIERGRVPDRQIAKTVLEMCEQHHIHG